MPLIEIYRRRDQYQDDAHPESDRKAISDSDTQFIGVLTRELVARELDTPEEPDGRLTVDDIEVQIRDGHRLDLDTLPLQIIVYANDFPARRANLDDRRRRIADELRINIPWLKGNCFIWILLCPASFEIL